ncbi:MAG TPA: efflux RND transporter periplasmic adaptor subunit, partial [Chthoniobacterales bacterium]|nr:efflux RND transporter periplasmic adaptor subunit [Chthoniobacterales bacterium]
MSKRLIFGIIGVLVLLIGWWGFQHRGSPDASSSTRTSGRRGAGSGGPVPIVAGTVEQKDMPIYLGGLGTVQAFNTVTVHTRVDGALVQVNFSEGQDVKTGDLLAVVDPKPYQAALDQAKAQATLDQVTLKRQTDLRARNVIAQQDYDTAVANAEKSKAAAEAAQVNLDYCYVKSPIDGRTGVRLVDIGNVVHAADQTGIVVITQLHPISVVFTLPEQNLSQVLHEGGANGGLKVLALDRGNTNTLDEGSLAVVDNEIDPTTGTVKLKATFPNDDLKLWPGKFVNARLVLTTRKDATVIPSSVVQRGPQGTYAYLIKPDKTVEMRPIKVAQTEGNLALVDEGLQPGEQVVVDGQYKLQPGAHVELTTPQPSKQSRPAQVKQAGQKV